MLFSKIRRFKQKTKISPKIKKIIKTVATCVLIHLLFNKKIFRLKAKIFIVAHKTGLFSKILTFLISSKMEPKDYLLIFNIN